MNFKRLLLFLAAPLALVMSSCEPDGPVYTNPSISITDADGAEVTAVNFSAEGGDATITITATRGWSISKQATWLGVTPSTYTNDTMEEKSVDVKITVGPNDSDARTETIKVVMDKMEKNVVVSQAGEGQTALGEDLYYDNFDKKEAATDSNGYWPYMSAEYGNPMPESQTGVTYNSHGVTVRNNSNSNGKYSDIADKASGVNNVFFGNENYLTISGISLAELTGNALTVTFAGDKYQKDGDSNFSTEEFKVYISGDGEKWTLLPYTFAGTTEGRWNTATAQFNFKEVPETLSFYFTATVASVYRLDDLKLTAGGGGVEIDLANGTAIDNTGGGDQGGDQGGETPAPENALLWASFATDMANFTTENVELGGLDYVWYHDAQHKQMKASAYKDNVRYVTESYLVSPVVALTGAEDYYMNFEHTGKFFGNMSEQATLWVREEGGAWAQLTIPTYMTGNDWTFVNSGDIALTAYAGKNIQIGFRYTSTATDAPSWEVKNVLVAKGTAGETPEDPETPNVPLESIDATSDAAFVCSTDNSDNAVYGLGESTANGASATGFKLGKGKQEGKFTSTAVGVSGDKYLNFFAVSWGAGGDKTIYFRVNGGEVKSQAIRANDGAKGNAPYTMSVYANDHYSVLLSGLNETDVIEFGTNADFALTTHTGTGDDYAPRVIFFGVKLTDEPVSGESGEGGGNTEPEDPEDPEDPETPEDPEDPEDPEEPTTVTLDEITEYGTYNITGATVVAVEYSNMVVKGTEKMFNVKKLANASANYNVGDVLSLTNATVKDAYGVTVIDGEATDLVIEKTGTTTVEHGEATAIDAAWVTSFTESLVPEYVTVSGVGAASGSPYSLNIAVEGSDINMSVTLPTKDEVTALVGKNVTATGYAFDYNSKNKYVSIMKVDLTVVEGGETPEDPEDPEIPVEPETLEALDANAYYVFKQATEFAPGKWYAMVAENNAATALTSDFGYLKVVTPIALTEGISLPASCAWGIVSTEGGYTIQQYDGKYVYQTGTYDSFNVDATAPASGHVWTIENGVITNAETSKTVQFDTKYNSYGCYDSVKGVYPAFYELVEVDTNAHLLGTSVSSLSYTADGGEKTFDVTTYGEATLEATTAAEWLTVSVADGVVTVVAAANEGEAREAEVTVTFGEDSATVTVAQAAPLAEGEAAWVLVTDAATLAVGDQIVIVSTGYDKALSTTQNNNNRKATSVTKSGNTVVIDNTVQVITLEAGTVANTFGFNVGTGYLYAASGSSNHLKTGTLNDNASWLVTIDGSGVATIKAQGDKARNWMRYNSSSDLFSCYASGQADIAIYKYTE